MGMAERFRIAASSAAMSMVACGAPAVSDCVSAREPLPYRARTRGLSCLDLRSDLPRVEIGNLRVRLERASDLVGGVQLLAASFLSSGIYVVVSLAAKKWTSATSSTSSSDPEWDEETSFVLESDFLRKELRVDVFSKPRLSGSDVSLGQLVVPVRSVVDSWSLTRQGGSAAVRISEPLKGVEQGSIDLELEFVPGRAEGEEYRDEDDDEDEEDVCDLRTAEDPQGNDSASATGETQPGDSSPTQPADFASDVQ